ncbi:MAG TPA: hypothetical protein VFJ76_00765 [Solirubrobacterales bacterium]|nr:hypothetical protein [Solirubrobacterales bacterium]
MQLAIDQLLFGYRDGHEMLAGSVDIDARMEAELLPHADARFEDDSEHYLVGLWISSLERFMLTRIWPAPELPRPGAVWAHALLLNGHDLKSMDPLLLLDYFRRPDGADLDQYRASLSLDISGKKPPVDVPRQLMLALSEAVYEPAKSGSVVIWPEEFSAETGLLALWRGLPSSMKRSLSFRTRGRARTGSSRYGLQIATQLAGRSASQDVRVIWPEKVDPANSVALLASVAYSPEEPLGVAVERFASNVEDARFVAEMWPLIDDGDAASLLQHLEARPDASSVRLGEALFAPADENDGVWRVTEAERIKALLQATVAQYLHMLNVGRLKAAWKSDRQAVLEFLDERQNLADYAADLLLDTAIDELSVDELVERLHDSELVELALSKRNDLLREPSFWSFLELSAGPDLRAHALAVADHDVAAILIEKGYWGLLDQLLDHPDAFASVAEHLARSSPASLRPWTKVMKGREHQVLNLLSRKLEPEISILAAATLPRESLAAVPLQRWLEAAPAIHKRQDQASSAAAARLIATTYKRKEAAARELLIECFGPAHNALERRNLPQSVLAELKDLLPSPKTKSLAKRLNRALIASMESSRWTEGELKRALENAGPEAHRLVKLVPKKNPLRRRIESTLHDLEDLLPLP